jgi:LysR family glycine cleavage system transcriptional activator
MRKLPPQSQLRAFEAAARHLSFKKAADELAVTPTAISHHIRSLEEFCGQSLFRRRPRPIILTDAGARLYPVLRQGLDTFESALSTLREDGEAVSLRVTTTSAIANRWLIPRLAKWRKVHPEIVLDIIGTQTVVDLKAGEADVAIRYMQHAPDDLVSHELFRDQFVLVGSPKIHSKSRSDGQRMDLRNQTLINTVWSSPRAPTWQRWLAMAREVNPNFSSVGEQGVLSFDEELNAIDAMITGQGIGICSDVLIRSELEAGSLVKLADFAMPGLGFYLVYAPHHPRQPLIDRFLPWARSVD